MAEHSFDPLTYHPNVGRIEKADNNHAVAFLRGREGDPEADAYGRLFVAAPDLAAVAEALLLFHSASPWDADKAARWKALTGQESATTKVLCCFARAALAKLEQTDG